MTTSSSAFVCSTSSSEKERDLDPLSPERRTEAVVGGWLDLVLYLFWVMVGLGWGRGSVLGWRRVGMLMWVWGMGYRGLCIFRAGCVGGQCGYQGVRRRKVDVMLFACAREDELR